MTKDEANRKIEEIIEICKKQDTDFLAEAVGWLLKDRIDRLAKELEVKE